jgi:hypothetical protein
VKYIAIALTLIAPAFAENESVEGLKKRIAALEKKNRALAARLEGTVAPINLARTSLAAVSASSVNGDRPLDSPYYGVLNLFDEGTNRHNGTAYPYWLSNCESRPWVEVRFDRPVTIAAIEVGRGPAFLGRLIMEKGGEQAIPESKDRYKLPTPRSGVRAVRITFEMEQSPLPKGVHELRILGYAPAGAEFRVERPRVVLTRAHVKAVAQERFREWKEKLLGKTRETVTPRKDGTWEVRFFRGDVELLQVVVGNRGVVKLTPRVRIEGS